ncbi:MAG: Fe-S cluster assembly protein SufD [Pseudomonadota bacterium]
MTLQNKPDQTSIAFVSRYEEARGNLLGAADWIAHLRDDAARSFSGQGLPTRRVEDWKYTDLAKLRGVAFDGAAEPGPVTQASLPALLFGRDSKLRMVFVNGRFDADLSTIGTLPDGVRLMSLREALVSAPELLEGRVGATLPLDDAPLAALNTAFMSDGVVLQLDDGANLAEPLEILAVGTGGEAPPVYHPRNLIIAGKNAHATVVEHHVGLCIGAYFSNIATEIIVDDGAILRHCVVQDESRDAFHIATTHATVGQDAQYDNFAFALGGAVSRNEIRVKLAGAGADCRLSGAYLGRGSQVIDNTSVIEHAVADTTSKELFKGVLDGKARGVFQGKIVVQPDAQRTDGQQMNRALLLSDGAEIDSKPELEIFADDVKCAHGATVGELDSDALFYMRARGVPEAQARRLLIEAFLGEVIDAVALTGMRLSLEDNVSRWMNRKDDR